MESTLQGNTPLREHHPHATLTRAIGWGMLGGFAGMLVVDLLLMGGLSAAGISPLACFSMVGNTMERFFLLLGIDIPGGVPAGVATHYVVGPLLGVVFGTALVRYGAHRAGTLKKCVVAATVYAEIASQPLFAMIPLLMKMTASDTILWFVGSVVMHFIWGIILGLFVGHGLRLASGSKHTPFSDRA